MENVILPENMNAAIIKPTKRTKVALITGTKMDQTATAVVWEWKRHPIIGKRYKKTKKYLVHNPDNKYQVDETVIITETRPISRHKHWLISAHATKEEAKS